MKSLYESLLTGKVAKPSALTQAQSREDLEQLISEYMEEIKPRPGQELDLNWIDISLVDDLSYLFQNTLYIPIIDKWKIDQVRDFRYMFADNKYIVRSPLPRLQTKLLHAACYAYMFSNCTSLKVAPELPATQLAKYCYSSMFYGCTSLQVAPELPAKKLEPYCYSSMFYECISLEVAPQLPAMELAEWCYWGMFNGCEKLKAAPALPAVNLKSACYDSMFKNCKSLKNRVNAPFDKSINAFTNRARYANGMYKGCPCENK